MWGRGGGRGHDLRVGLRFREIKCKFDGGKIVYARVPFGRQLEHAIE